MTSTPRLPKAEITGLSGWLLKRLSRKQLGEVPEAAGVVRHGEAGDPFGGGGERDPVSCLAGPDAQPDGQVGLAGAGRAEEHHVVPPGDEVQGAQVGDGVAFESAGVVEVELL